MRKLSVPSPVYLCRESASERLVVLKFFEASKEKSFLREAKALSILEEYPCSPNLYFAREVPGLSAILSPAHQTLFCIGMQYRPARSWMDLKDTLSSGQIRSIREEFEEKLRILHHDFGFVHGDISPKNILMEVHAAQGNPPGERFQISFIDWEFSEKITEGNLQSYDSYRGTLGFTQPSTVLAPKNRDLEAFEACMKFLGKGPEKPMRKKWLDWI